MCTIASILSKQRQAAHKTLTASKGFLRTANHLSKLRQVESSIPHFSTRLEGCIEASWPLGTKPEHFIPCLQSDT